MVNVKATKIKILAMPRVVPGANLLLFEVHATQLKMPNTSHLLYLIVTISPHQSIT